jgi:hypothetical protein
VEAGHVHVEDSRLSALADGAHGNELAQSRAFGDTVLGLAVSLAGITADTAILVEGYDEISHVVSS